VEPSPLAAGETSARRTIRGAGPALAGGPVFAALLALAALQAWATRAMYGKDLGVVLRAGQRALLGEPLYRLSDGHWCFKYSPPVALLAAPLVALPQALASLLVALGSAAALLALLRWSARELGAERRWGSAAAALALAAPYALHLLAVGQLDALLVALVLWSEALAPRRPVTSGALLAAASLVKPPFLLLLTVPVLWREGRRIGGFALAVALAFAAAALRYGAAGLGAELHGWRELLAATTPALLCDAQNQSLWAVVCTYLAPPSASARYQGAVVAAAAGLAALSGGLALAAARDTGRRRFLALGLALYLAAALSPLGWRANLVGALPLLFLLVEQARGASLGWVRWVSAATALGVAGAGLASYDVVGRPAFAFLLQHRQYAFACAAAVLVALLGAAAEARPAMAGPEPRR
jgi:hypothetical protein